MQITPKLEFRRKPSDSLPLLVLFGVTVQDGTVTAEAHYIRERTRKGATVKSDKVKLKLPPMWPGFEIAPVEFSRG
ncbi:hypothetical protein Q0M94_28250 (plasmid) [Deinococcus radiomollis]|uniref:hypothetical protein n=1 Tax=Deinococcus radiomollis TaxID=468916 RepID=UPI00389199BC